MVDTPASGPAITWAYYYDWLDRLIRVDKDTVQQSVYVYDESDNRLELQLPGETHHYTFDFADRLLARSVNSTPTETFSHDADGNMIARTAGGVTTNYSWDSFDKLTSIQKPGFQQSFRYDSEGIRKSKGSDTRYFSSGATSLVDLLPTNSISYIQGHLILGMLQGGNYYWYIPDGLGTVRLVMDSSGTTVVSSFASDEFGRQTAVTGSPAHTFTGALGVRNEVGIDSQLLYARQRWYDPTIGRFLSQDPIGFAGGLNMYTGMANNPINNVDPSGLLKRYTTGPNKGQIIFTPVGQPGLAGQGLNGGGKVYSTMQGGYITTDRGRRVDVFQNKRIEGQPYDKRMNTNCAGNDFADGAFWVQPNEATKIAKDEFRELGITEIPRSGDKVIYYDYDSNQLPVHTMTVSDVPPDYFGSVNSVTVKGKNGAGPIYNAPLFTGGISKNAQNGYENQYSAPLAFPTIYRPRP